MNNPYGQHSGGYDDSDFAWGKSGESNRNNSAEPYSYDSTWVFPPAAPPGAQQGAMPTQQLPFPPQQAPMPQQAQPSNNGLKVTLGALVVVLVAMLAVGGFWAFSGGSEEDALAVQDRDPVAAGDSSSSESEPTTITHTRTVETTRTSTVAEEAQPEEPTRTRTSTPRTTENSGDFGWRAFRIDRSDIDASGWVGSTARCASGYYARILAVAQTGKAVICESSNSRNERYYIGDFGDISTNPKGYEVVNFSTTRAVARNGTYTYELTDEELTVRNNGEVIFSEYLSEWGYLRAG